MPVKNFLVYYWIDENHKTVWITAIVYGGRDQLNVLKICLKTEYSLFQEGPHLRPLFFLRRGNMPISCALIPQ